MQYSPLFSLESVLDEACTSLNTPDEQASHASGQDAMQQRQRLFNWRQAQEADEMEREYVACQVASQIRGMMMEG